MVKTLDRSIEKLGATYSRRNLSIEIEISGAKALPMQQLAQNLEMGIGAKDVATTRHYSQPYKKTEFGASKNPGYRYFYPLYQFLCSLTELAAVAGTKTTNKYTFKFCDRYQYNKFLTEQPKCKFVGSLWRYQRYTNQNSSKNIGVSLKLYCPILGKYGYTPHKWAMSEDKLLYPRRTPTGNGESPTANEQRLTLRQSRGRVSTRHSVHLHIGYANDSSSRGISLFQSS
jgi:hypothetical protein